MIVLVGDVDDPVLERRESFDTTGRSSDDMGWVSKQYQFVAVGEETRITFRAISGGSHWGPAIDCVSVLTPEGLAALPTPTPVPASTPMPTRTSLIPTATPAPPTISTPQPAPILTATPTPTQPPVNLLIVDELVAGKEVKPGESRFAAKGRIANSQRGQPRALRVSVSGGTSKLRKQIAPRITIKRDGESYIPRTVLTVPRANTWTVVLFPNRVPSGIEPGCVNVNLILENERKENLKEIQVANFCVIETLEVKVSSYNVNNEQGSILFYVNIENEATVSQTMFVELVQCPYTEVKGATRYNLGATPVSSSTPLVVKPAVGKRVGLTTLNVYVIPKGTMPTIPSCSFRVKGRVFKGG